MNKLIFLFVTLFGVGKLKNIPGSYASLITTIFLFLLFHILNFSPNIILICIVIVFLISLYAVNIFIKLCVMQIKKMMEPIATPVCGIQSKISSAP